jgi:hypothetical protein
MPCDSGVALEADPAVEVQVAPLEVEEKYVTIRDRQSGQRIVTVIELVSPTNKYAGPGRVSYVSQQTEVRQSPAHLMEIDLLRIGPHVAAVPEWAARARAVRVPRVCQSGRRSARSVSTVSMPLARAFAAHPIPLVAPDPDIVLDIQAVLAHTYEVGGYAERLNYAIPCVPPLSPEDQTWADGLIRQAMG